MTDSIDIASAAAPSPSFDRADLEVALRVLGAAHELPEDHPDRIALRDATSGMYKSARKKRRRDFRDAVSSADREVVAFLAASLAFGRVGAIRDSIERLLAALGPSPAAAVARVADLVLGLCTAVILLASFGGGHYCGPGLDYLLSFGTSVGSTVASVALSLVFGAFARRK